MIDPSQIPDEVVEAAAIAIIEAFRNSDCDTGQCSSYRYRIEGKCGCREDARAAIAAALAAWPGVEMRPTFNPSRVILPLPKEPST